MGSRSFHKGARCLRVVDDGLKLTSGGATFADRAAPAIVHHVWPKSGVRVLAVEVGWRDETLEALRVSSGSACADIHVATADPFGPGCYTYLVARAVIAYSGAGGVRAVAVIVARKETI